MAQNPVPAALDALFTLAEDMADGAATHEVAIGIQHHKEVKIRADLAAARTAQQTYVNARTAKVVSTGVQTVAESMPVRRASFRSEHDVQASARFSATVGPSALTGSMWSM